LVPKYSILTLLDETQSIERGRRQMELEEIKKKKISRFERKAIDI
jgi:hypothetical protein